MSDVWCPLPWIHQFVQTTGVKTCCNGNKNLAVSLREFASSSLVEDIKQSIRENKIHPNCTSCIASERSGFDSIRNEAVRQYPHYNIDNIPDTVEYLDLRYNNLCNFSCRTCDPTFSSSIAKELADNPSTAKWFSPVEKVNNYASIEQELDYILPTVRRINFTGGEPMLVKENLLVLDKLIKLDKLDCEILITTNASAVNPNWLSMLGQFKSVHWTISIDGVGSTAEYIRFGTKWSQVDHNIKSILSLGHSVAFNTVVSAYSVLDIDRLIQYSIDCKNISLMDHWFHLCKTPTHLNPKVLTGDLASTANKKLLSAIELLKTVGTFSPMGLNTLIETIGLLGAGNQLLVDRFNEYTAQMDSIRNQNFWIDLQISTVDT